MINYELKNTNPAAVKLNDQTGDATITIGFTTGAVGCPLSYGMVAGDVIKVTVADYVNKTVVQTDTEVMNAVNAFIAAKYPST